MIYSNSSKKIWPLPGNADNRVASQAGKGENQADHPDWGDERGRKDDPARCDPSRSLWEAGPLFKERADELRKLPPRVDP